ncbi:MAG: transcription elongation factor GreA [Chloroflexi bacterium]|nr:transcription elongation factor GreA [Chloroflexota bacterium]
MVRRETFLTSEGLTKLEAELDLLRRVRRPEAAQRIQRAKEVGGTEDNAEYEEAKNQQAFIEGRIRELEDAIKNAVLIPDDRKPTDTVEIGSVVEVKNPQGRTQAFTIVGRTEADPAQGRISNESPVGRALLGHKAGEQAEVETPSGKIKLTIVKIE